MAGSPFASPFARAAAYYDDYRAPYAPAAIQHVVSAFGLGPGVRVTDLGCGPGTLAIPFALAGAAVTAVDPSAEMLEEGRRIATERGVSIDWVQGRAEDALVGLGPARLISFGQSLHWMARDRVLALAAQALEPGSGIVIFDEGARRPQESWEVAAARTAARYAGRRERHPGKHPEVAHTPCLDRSAHFRDYEIREFPHRIVRDLPSILGCVYSGVGFSPQTLGDHRLAFEADLADALLALRPDGVFEEELETAVIIARMT